MGRLSEAGRTSLLGLVVIVALQATGFGQGALNGVGPMNGVGPINGVGPKAGGDSFALRAGRVYTATENGPLFIEDCWVVVRDGRIEAVGRDVTPPADLPRRVEPDMTVVPGLVAAASSIVRAHPDAEATGAGFRAIDAYDRYADYRLLLSKGVTTVHLNPGGHRLIPGQGAVVKVGGDPSRRILREAGELCVVLGESAFAPPLDERVTAPTSSDQAIEAGRPQRPLSRLGQLLGLRETLEAALAGVHEDRLRLHSVSLASLWRANTPVRVQADRGVDILSAISFLRGQDRTGYVVGGAEAHQVADLLRRSGTPLVYQPRVKFRTSGGGDIGLSPDAMEADLADLHQLSGIEWVLAPPVGEATGDLRLVAASARSLGIRQERALAAITRGPAQLLGVSDRVGSLAQGRDADLVVMTGDPLLAESHVHRVYIGGELVFEAPKSNAVVVRAGTIWVSPEQQFRPGEILIEEGKITAVGASVPHPPGSRIMEAGPDAFVSPGFIDAHGHLGLDGDKSAAAAFVDLTRLFGAPDSAERRVARAGITTVMLSSYAFSRSGSRVAAIKTAGDGREERVVATTAAIAYDFSRDDPAAIASAIDARLTAGRKYVAGWQKYEKAMQAWRRGDAAKDTEETEETTTAPDDPVTGVWEGTASGGPLGEAQTGKFTLQRSGNAVEGRLIEPEVNIPHRILLTLNGDSLTGTIEVDIPQLTSPPVVEARLLGDEKMKGTVQAMGFTINLEGQRVEKEAVEFKVTKTRSTQDGRPVKPRIDEQLEPIRAWLEKRIPALLKVESPSQVAAVLDHVTGKLELPVVLLGASGAVHHTERLREKKVGVVVPQAVASRRRGKEIVPSDRLSRDGVSVAFQSNAEDGARHLPHVALYAVERGLAADRALAALTSEPAKMFGIADRVGTLEVGRDGDLVVFRGHPFRGGGQVLRVLVNGEEVQ